jgi:hypothetical protein
MLERSTLPSQSGAAGTAAATARQPAYGAKGGRGAPGGGFTQTLQTVQSGRSVTVDAGDTLIGMIRDLAKAKGQSLNAGQEFHLAQKVAQANGIGNANRIYTGQKIDLSVVEPTLAALATAGAGRGLPATAIHLAPTPISPPAAATAAAVLQNTVRIQTPVQMAMNRHAEVTMPRPVHSTVPTAFDPSASLAHPVLVKTLDRAVAKGFIPPAEKAAVYDKILDMSQNHGFAPDDFARMTLMESDGMNPRASNQRCHGIIQFCDGPARGAASAGYAANPKAILDLSVHKQLSLVDKYFDDVGLKTQGPAGLEDLYLSVLNPASRAENKLNAPLNIPGPQARSLHVGSDSSAPITRHSIRQGLLQNAAARLGQMLPPSLRQQAQRAQQYVEDSLP